MPTFKSSKDAKLRVTPQKNGDVLIAISDANHRVQIPLPSQRAGELAAILLSAAIGAARDKTSSLRASLDGMLVIKPTGLQAHQCPEKGEILIIHAGETKFGIELRDAKSIGEKLVTLTASKTVAN